jgi:hypothetical protein
MKRLPAVNLSVMTDNFKNVAQDAVVVTAFNCPWREKKDIKLSTNGETFVHVVTVLMPRVSSCGFVCSRQHKNGEQGRNSIFCNTIFQE